MAWWINPRCDLEPLPLLVWSKLKRPRRYRGMVLGSGTGTRFRKSTLGEVWPGEFLHYRRNLGKHLGREPRRSRNGPPHQWLRLFNGGVELRRMFLLMLSNTSPAPFGVIPLPDDLGASPRSRSPSPAVPFRFDGEGVSVLGSSGKVPG